jgi:hypothetical protein
MAKLTRRDVPRAATDGALVITLAGTDPRRQMLLVEHDLFPKTGIHFSGSCSRVRGMLGRREAAAPYAITHPTTTFAA